jgi:hypothetical protein
MRASLNKKSPANLLAGLKPLLRGPDLAGPYEDYIESYRTRNGAVSVLYVAHDLSGLGST